MSADSSGSFGSDLLDAINDPKPKKKPHPKPKSRTTRPPRPRRPPLNLDDLLDGIEPTIPDSSPMTRAVIPVTTDPIVIVERRVSDYLSRCLRTVMDEFSVCLNDLLADSSGPWGIVTEFTENLKQNVRDEILQMRAEEDIPVGHVLQGFESAALKFRALYQELESRGTQSTVQKVKDVNAAMVAVASYRQSIPSDFSCADISQELRELGQMRAEWQAERHDSAKKARQTFLCLLDLEVEQKRQRYESDLIQQRLNWLEQGRRKMDELDTNTGFPNASLRADLRRLTEELSLRIDSSPRLSVGSQLKDIENARANLSSCRRTQEYQFATLRNKLAGMQTVPVQVAPVVAPAPPRVDQKNIATETRSGLLSDVQERLRSLQQKRETTLEDTSKFLSNIRRKERKRTMREISKVVNPESSLNALFSFV
jgi:hypothetical protein